MYNSTDNRETLLKTQCSRVVFIVTNSGLEPLQVNYVAFCPEALSCISLLAQHHSNFDVDLIAAVYVYKLFHELAVLQQALFTAGKAGLMYVVS